MYKLPLQVLGEDTDPIAICQWSVSTSPGLNPLDASADSGSDIGADRQLVDNCKSYVIAYLYIRGFNSTQIRM